MANSELYKSIALYYDHIFPIKQPAVGFTRQFLPSDALLLDAGCATGNMAAALAPYCKYVDAFDLDPDMVNIAKEKFPSTKYLSFFVGDMFKIKQQFGSNKYDLILCYGNTLVHLLSELKILHFLTQAYGLLQTNAHLLIQILNYNYILDEKVKQLPLIDNDFVRFERQYIFEKHVPVIDFQTLLTIKSTGQQIQNSVPLYALRPQNLHQLLQKAGFKHVEMYSSYKMTALSDKELPLVVKAVKA